MRIAVLGLAYWARIRHQQTVMSNTPQSKTAGSQRGAIGSIMINLALLLAASVLMTGCAHYDVSLNNGTKFTNVRKPVLNKETGYYTIKNATGKAFTVKASRVLVIEPHQSAKSKMRDGSSFLN